MNVFLIFAWSLSFGLLVGCTQKVSDPGTGVERVTVGYGVVKNISGANLLQPNSMNVSNLVIETISVCGGATQTITSNQNPATNIPVCKSDMGTYPKLMKVDIVLLGTGQEERKYTLDLSKPDQMPSELKLSRIQEGNSILYQITDKGGAVKSSVEIITLFLNSSLSITYLDQHFFEGFTFESISDAVVRATYVGCATCVTEESLSTLPQGFKIVKNAPGNIEIDSSAALGGSYELMMAVKKDASSTEVKISSMNMTINRAVVAPVTNLFQNSGFEAESILPWTPILSTLDRKDSPIIHSDFSGKTLYFQTVDQGPHQSFVQEVSLTAGKKYRLRVPFHISQSMADANAILIIYHASGPVYVSHNFAKDMALSYTEVRVIEFTAQETKKTPIIIEGSNDPYSLFGGPVTHSVNWYFDNLSLEEIP